MNRIFACILFLSLPTFVIGQIQIGQDIDGEAAGDICGRSTSMSSDGTIIALGCPWDPHLGSRTGKVMVFEESGGVWSQLGQSLFGGSSSIWFGYDVSISGNGNRLAVGAYYHASTTGQVQIYEFQGGSWVQIGADLLGDAIGDRFGESVSLSEDGSRVVIGAPFNDLGGNDAGVTKVFEYVGSSWVQVGSNIFGEAVSDQSGVSVSISDDGSRIATGARVNDGNGNVAGHVRIFDEVGGAWVQVGNDLDGDATLDFFGTEVALSGDGDRIIVGSMTDYAKVFEENAGTWTLIGGRINGPNAGDEFARAVSISETGSRIAIGAQFNDDNGNNSGQIKVFEEMGGTWVQIGSDINGENPGDYFGHDFSIELSADGQKVSGGGFLNSDNGTAAGHARVFELNIILANFSSFYGKQIGSQVELTWEIDGGYALEKYEIERSFDTKEWEKLGHLESQNSMLQFLDSHPKPGLNYYRLRKSDVNGNTTFSNTIEIPFTASEERPRIFPNPSDGSIQLKLPAISAQPIRLAAFNLVGELIFEELLVSDYSSNSIDLPFPGNGMYLIQIHIGEKAYHEHLMILNR